MDLYRYFHPQYNPRLRNTPLRLMELGELEQAAGEMKKALHRAQIRTENAPIGPLRGEHFSELLVAIDYIVETLGTLTEAHPGDDNKTMEAVLEERKNAPGWENWVALLQQRLELISKCSTPEEFNAAFFSPQETPAS